MANAIKRLALLALFLPLLFPLSAFGPIGGNGNGGGSGGAVSSVSNSDGTLTVSPTTGDVVASLNLGHANIFTAGQTMFGTSWPSFAAGDFIINGLAGTPTFAANGEGAFWVDSVNGASWMGDGSSFDNVMRNSAGSIVFENVHNTQDVQFLGTIKNVNNSLQINATGIVNPSTANNAAISVPSTGAAISRNVADSNVALTVSQSNASSTGDIQDWKNNGGIVTKVTQAGELVLPASATATASLNIPQGSAPTSPVNGDIWTTSLGVFAQIAGSTVGPFGGGVTSVSNSDSTLTISPTVGAVVASLNLSHANTWAAAQTFTNSDLLLLGSSTGATTFTSDNAGASNFTVHVPAANDTITLNAATQTLTNKSIAASEINSGQLAVGNGGTGAGSFTIHGVMLGNSTSALNVTAAGASGNLLIGQGAADPTWNAMSGDCTISNSGAITCTKINGDSNIAFLDVAQSWTKPQRTNLTTPAISTSTFTPVFSSSQNFRIVLVHASCPCTLANPAAIVAGQSGMFEIVQSATGSDTIGTWGSEYEYAGGTSTITLSTGANAVDYIPYYVDSTGSFIVLGGIIKGPSH